jgi:hypothetical protein
LAARERRLCSAHPSAVRLNRIIWHTTKVCGRLTRDRSTRGNPTRCRFWRLVPTLVRFAKSRRVTKPNQPTSEAAARHLSTQGHQEKQQQPELAFDNGAIREAS